MEFAVSRAIISQVLIFLQFSVLRFPSFLSNSSDLDPKMPDLTTASIVVDYIYYKLKSEGLACPAFRASQENDLNTSTPPALVQTTIKKMTQTIEQRFYKECNGLSITDSLHVTPSTAFLIFQRVTREIFYADTNAHGYQASIRPSRGRILGLLAFSGALAAQCVHNEMPQMVDQVANWTIRYIDGYLLAWINSNGGWETLMSPPPRNWFDGSRLFIGMMLGVAAVFMAVKLVK